jgi:glycosyltransferase involved in cell wall biosynthesis
MTEFPGRLAVQQRVLPNYRVPFFDLLAGRCRTGLALFAGEPLPSESIPTGAHPLAAEYTSGQSDHTFHPGHPLYVCRQPGLLDWLDAAKPDVLILEANPRYPDNFTAIDRMHESGIPVLGWGLGIPAERGVLSAVRSKARSRLLERLDGIIAYSQHGAASYAAAGLFRPDRVFVAHNAVAAPAARTPAQPGSGEGPLNLLFVGRLQRRKRLDLLFEACAALPEDRRPTITVVGDGPDRNAFEQMATALRLDVSFTGALSGDPLAARFRAADLFVLPGTGGLAVQEAMSYGLPVIVAEGDGTQRDLVRPENGWLVVPEDAAGLHGALLTALSDRSALARKGAESRRITVEEINIDTMADRFIGAALAVSGIS